MKIGLRIFYLIGELFSAVWAKKDGDDVVMDNFPNVCRFTIKHPFFIGSQFIMKNPEMILLPHSSQVIFIYISDSFQPIARMFHQN